MRYVLTCLAVLLLASCIPVEDWGGYWDKGVVYPEMAGTWREVGKSGGPGLVRIVNKKGTYRVDSLDPKDRRDKDYTPMFAKSLQVGQYSFLMTSTGAVEKSDRNLVRYLLEKGTLTEYSLSDDAMAKFLRWHHPFARNIAVSGCKEKCLLHSVRIKVFDSEVFKILAEIPNTPEFWSVADQWRKVGAAPRADKPHRRNPAAAKPLAAQPEIKPSPPETPRAEPRAEQPQPTQPRTEEPRIPAPTDQISL